MKRTLFSFTALIVSVSINAQLEVSNSGQVTINSNGNNITKGLFVKAKTVGIHGDLIESDTVTLGVGVYGHAKPTHGNQICGVRGVVAMEL